MAAPTGDGELRSERPEGNGRWAMDDGRWAMDDGQWAEACRAPEPPSCRLVRMRKTVRSTCFSRPKDPFRAILRIAASAACALDTGYTILVYLLPTTEDVL